jgi:hypothetical protein
MVTNPLSEFAWVAGGFDAFFALRLLGRFAIRATPENMEGDFAPLKSCKK